MSPLIGLFFVSVSLGLSNCAASIGIGLSGVDAKTRLQTGLVFGFFEAAMPIVGLLIGQRFAGALGMVGHFLGAGLLMLTGLYAIFQAYRERHQPKSSEKGEQQKQRQGIGRLLLLGFALSVDNLVVGFALSFSHTSILLAAGVIAVVSVTMSLVGLQLGHHLSERLEEWSEIFGGCVFLLVGIALLFNVL